MNLAALSVAGLGLGAISTGLVVMTLARGQARRVGSGIRYADGQYLVDVRYGEWNDIREFVQPSDPDVVTIAHQYPDYWSLYDLVCRDISYRRDTGEFWQTPGETIARARGDCEDTSILLTSLIRADGTPVYIALGSYQDFGHAWCQYRGEILESTFTRARPVPDPEHYQLYCLFNDQEVVELWPGALEELFALRRDEVSKLRLMASG